MHFLQRCLDRSRQHIGCSALQRMPQQPMHHCTVFCGVDGFALEHAIALRQHPGLLCQHQKLRFNARIPMVLGQVCKDARRFLAEMNRTLCIGCKSITQIKTRKRFRQRLQVLPCDCLVTPHHGPLQAFCAANIKPSNLMASTQKARMPSANFSVAMASSFKAKRKAASLYCTKGKSMPLAA